MTVNARNLSYEVLRILGSPLISKNVKNEVIESKELFEHAYENRVGLLYLDILRREGKLHILTEEYKNLRDRQIQTRITLARACELVNDLHVPYFVTMTERPFPYISNDVELVHLGDKNQYGTVIETFRKKGYVLLSTGPDASLLGDPRGRDVVMRDKSGGRYYVDYSTSLSVDYFQFIDKYKMAKLVKPILIEDVSIPLLDVKMELASAIIHSVMEQRIGMEIYYYTCWVISKLDEHGLKDLKQLFRKQHATTALRIVLSIITQIHEDLFGGTPTKLRYLNNLLPPIKSEADYFISLGRKLHHRILLSSFLLTLVLKQLEWNAFKSSIVQACHMAKPTFFKDVILQLKRRRSDEDVYKLM